MKKDKRFESERIHMLRELLQMSQSDFAEKIHISQGALSQIESGKSSISVRTLKNISLELNVNCNWLLNGKGEVFMNEEPPAIAEAKTVYIPVDGEQVHLIPLVREEAQAGYIDGYDQEEYISTLDVYKIPGFEEGNYRMFEVEGDSMIPTLYPREIVVSEYIPDWDELENGTLAILLTEKGIIAKRIYFYEKDRQMLILKSDNAQYKTYSIEISKIKEVWRVASKITSVFAEPGSLHAHKIDKLEASIDHLKKELKKIVKK